ncbi:MAG: hypothetical protein BGO49_26310 [Planctomycetales bacterium 71-10]|nr:MAG: hypothetical protein BGO49_26310 [Planctomycetales bacterium 71-10]
MNCRDFDQTWNRLLDAESGTRRDDGPEAAASRLARESGLREHAESCPSCRIRHRQFEALRVAMRAWSARPRPEPAAAVDRIVLAASPAPRPRRAWPLAWASGLAAAAVAASFFRPPPRDEPAPAPARRASLSVAMSDAREASLRLALTASEPAARLGLAMLDASIATDFGPDDVAPAPDDDAEVGPDASDLATRVGGYAAAGARPLSDAARRAFGFLRTPSLDKTAPTASPRGT